MFIPDFPITPYLAQICNSLRQSESHALILTAETGAGKSTILPLGLLNNFNGKILMTEPRRIAVLGVANRISDLLNEPVGQTAGYRIHLENKTSSKTRLEVMTEAILVKMLQENPTLEGYNIVVLDEAHERSINFDLALAFLKEAMVLRDDLSVVIMSATINCEKLSAFLDRASVISIPGRTFPVQILYKDSSSLENIIINEIYDKNSGNILVFLPGISDIKRCRDKLLENYPSVFEDSNIEIHILHSSVSIEDQKKILVPSPDKKRIILSSAIAETSLTIPGIKTVIDTGLARISRININTGIQSLVTEPESEFSAEQRKGRAGREAPGKCIRLWNELDKRPEEIPPEILRTDLCELVLECAERGISNLAQIDWLDSPFPAEWKESVRLLQKFNFLTIEGTITEKGKAALSLGIHPRLANTAIEGFKLSPGNPEIEKLLIKYGNYEKSSAKIQRQFINDISSRLKKIDYSKFENQIKNPEGILLAGFPDRLAKKTGASLNNKTEFQFPNGRKAYFVETPDSKKHLSPSTQWIIAPEVILNKTEPVIFDFEPISTELVNQWIKPFLETKTECQFDGNRIRKTESICFDKIVISSKNLSAKDTDYKTAWANEFKNKGIKCLPSDKRVDDFLLRTEFYFQQNNKNKKLEDFLKATTDQWLLPFITSNSFSAQNVYDALYWFLDGTTIDKNVPQIIILENGSKVKIKYEKLASPDNKNVLVLRPVLEIIIQRIFGCHQTPKICGMNVLLRLLSPASRPLQITDDLENFWTTSWPDICREMKGRYPKHNWNPDIN